MKKIILLSVLVVLGVVALGQVAYAATSTVSVVPSTATKNVGAAFNTTISLVPQGNKVCVVTGTLTFTNLTCKSITVGSGIMAQVSPTCSNPKFILGIPNCTTAAQNIMTVSVKGNNVGQAILYFSGLNVIGAGTAVAFTGNGGLYNITAVPKPTPTPNPTLTSDLTAYNAALSAVVESDYTVESWATYQTVVIANPATTEDAQADVDTATANITAAQSALVLKTDSTPNPENNIPANVGAASFLSVASDYFWPILIILIIIAIGYGIYYFAAKRKKK
jgi:hypothetical protein